MTQDITVWARGWWPEPEGSVGETEAASMGPWGRRTGSKGVLLMGILFAEETRATRPGGWEGRGAGQPLSTETLSVWD